MPSSSEADATADLWSRRSPGTPAMAFAAALTGSDPSTLSDAASLSVASSPAATRLLEGMELRVRTLTTDVGSKPERCNYSVRGPVLWGETMTARSNSLGSEDVFVCSTPHRSFDTVENQVLATALDAISRAAASLQGPLGATRTPEQVDRVRAAAADARRWRNHPRLRDLRGRRLRGREGAKLRGGHRMARMAPVMAVLDQVAEPFGPTDLGALCDPPTRAVHRFVRDVLAVVVARGLSDGSLSLGDGALRSGAFSYRHPARGPRRDNGVTYRGVALLPPPELLEHLPWRDHLPERGIMINSPSDVEQVLDRLVQRERERRSAGRSVAQASGSSTSS